LEGESPGHLGPPPGYALATDVFVVLINTEEKPMTRLGLVSITSQFFNPIGFLQPFLLLVKLIVQNVWKDVTSWDEEIGEEERFAMQKWLRSTPYLANIKVPRCYLGLADADQSSFIRFLMRVL